MAQHCIKGKRIRRVCIPKEYDIDKIQIGIPVICDEAKKVGLIKNGDVVLPSGIFGAQCRRNAYGYSYADKSKPKERRYVSTNWVHPFGNTNASEVAVDIYRPCWPQVEVPPYGIELQLFKSKDGQLYVIVVLTDEIRANYLKEAVNILLEIYGVCYIFDGEIQLDYSSKRQKCNWEMLPPGEMPSRHIKKQLGERGEKTDTYDIFRLEYMEKYNSEKIVEGINGFKGYYAFIFSKCCVLESAIYGNANSDKKDDILRFMEFYTSDEALDAFTSAQKPDGPYAIKGYELPEDAYDGVKEAQEKYFDTGKTNVAMEFQTAVKGTNCEYICSEVATGQSTAEEAAKAYDEDCKKQATQLGLDWK